MGCINKLLGRGNVKAKGRSRHKASSYMRKNNMWATPERRDYLRTFANSDIDRTYGKKPRRYRTIGDINVPSSVKRVSNPRARRVRRGGARPPNWESERGIANLLGFKKRKGR